MNENPSEQKIDVDTILFINLISSLGETALVGMGKKSNPMTGKPEKNMEFAKANIDMIQMLKNKTEGNLSKQERDLLGDTLATLQLTYADELKRAPAEGDKEETDKSESEDIPESKEEEENPSAEK
jgi:hypothetical protein